MFYPARKAGGRPDLRFHDLRHTGAVLAAQTGATLAELMGRLGHSTARRALRYQHAAAGPGRGDRLAALGADRGQRPVTSEEDLATWWTFARSLSWTFATTYAAFAPHHYVVAGKTPRFRVEDARRVADLVRYFGEPGKYHSTTNLYLYSGDRRHKVWCQFSFPAGDGSDVRIVNLASANQVYGEQSGFDQRRLDDLARPVGRLAGLGR